MQLTTENVAKSPKFCTLIGNRSRGIKRRCQTLHRKFINNRFCAYAVQMLLKMAVNATICSPFKAQCGKSTSSRTTAIEHLGHLKRSRDFAHAQKLIRLLTQGRALLSQITLITFIVEPPKCIVNRQIRVGDSENVIFFDPLLAGRVIRRMRSSSVSIFNGNQLETL